MVRTYQHNNNSTIGIGFICANEEIKTRYFPPMLYSKFMDKSSSTEDLSNPSNYYSIHPSRIDEENQSTTTTTAVAASAVIAASKVLSAATDIKTHLATTRQRENDSICINCRKICGATKRTDSTNHYPVEYGDYLYHRRREENEPKFGSLRLSSSVDQLSGINEQGRCLNDMTNELQELSGSLARLQDATNRVNSSTFPRLPSDYRLLPRKTWSAPSDPYPPPLLYGKLDTLPKHNEYNPSILDDEARKNKRNGGNQMIENTNRSGVRSYLKELEVQMEDKKMRKQEEKSSLDWWEKKPPTFGASPRHSVQIQKSNLDLSRKTYERELREQMEEKKRYEENKKRAEKEEEEKMEKRIKEQQDRMKREYKEEQDKKIAKENLKLQRQKEMEKKHEEIRKEAENRRREASEKRFQEQKAARGASKMSQGTEPEILPPPPDEFRTESPPIPTLRGVKKSGSNSSISTKGESKFNQKNNQTGKIKTKLDELMDDLAMQDKHLDDPIN